MSFDLESFSAKDLDSLIKQASKRKQTLNKRKPITQVRRKLEAVARADGYSIAELFGSAGGAAPTRTYTRRAPSSRKGTKVAPKYRNPGNRTETWSGRGLPPRWMAELIKKGKKREDFLIKK